MLLFFEIAVGTVLAVLLVGLVLSGKLRKQPVWESLTHASGSPALVDAEQERKTDVHPTSEEGKMNVSTPRPTTRTPQDADLRRTTRIERPVPLLILGTNRRGETFQEKTSTVAINLHGCRYSSRHDYAPATWVTLQVTGTDGASAPTVRARVRSVVSARTPRELCQVGVEFEAPANIWGIPAPPEDWRRFLASSSSGNRAATGVAPAIAAPALESAGPAPLLESQAAPSERRSEVTMFPGPAVPMQAAHPSQSAAQNDSAPNNPERDMIAAELVRALQGKLQIAVDKAVQTSLSAQLDEVVGIAVGRIEESWRVKLAQIEESSARLAEAQNLRENELTNYRNRAEEIAARMETLTANSQRALSETQKFVTRFAGETAPQINARINDSFSRAGAEFKAKVAQLSEQHLAQISQSTQLAAREARSQLDESIAEVRSLLSTAGGGVSQDEVSQDGVSQEHSQSLLHSVKEEALSQMEERLGEIRRTYGTEHALSLQRTGEIARELESLASETRQARSQHEQSLVEIRSLLADAGSSASQDHFHSLLNSSTEQILSKLEWRLGEVSGHFEALLTQVHLHADELAHRVETLSTETRGHLAEARNLADRTPHELRPQDLSAIEQSVDRAAKEFETTASRVSDRQLIRMTEQKQAVSQEVALELEARGSEARSLLQKAANGTFEEFRRRVEAHVDLVVAEAKESVTSSLASLDAESRAAVEARRRSLDADVASAAEQSAAEFRDGIKAFLNSCLAAAVGAVDQHAQTTLAKLSTDTGGLRAAAVASGDSTSPSNPPPQPNLPAPS
jgi:hypothetical protein